MWSYREYIKAAKNDGLFEELLSENDFADALATFSCYNRGVTTGRGGGGQGAMDPPLQLPKQTKSNSFNFKNQGYCFLLRFRNYTDQNFTIFTVFATIFGQFTAAFYIF